MSRLLRRQTIIPDGNLIAWRRLSPDKLAYSGQLHLKRNYRHLKKVGYVSWLEFDFVQYYPASVGRWDEHWLGEKDGIIITMYAAQSEYIQGPAL